MFFRQIPSGPMQNFSYIVADDKSKEAAIFDCGWDVEEMLQIAAKEKLKMKKIILTHSHFDHVQKLNELFDRTKAEIFAHEMEVDGIKKSAKTSLEIKNLKDNDTISIGSLKAKILHTPGHSVGAMCILIENKLITGDTLFVNAIGRVDLPGGDALKLFESLQKIKKLDDSVEIYPGHDYGNIPFDTLGNQKKTNPYLKPDKKEDFLRLFSY